MSKVRKSSKAVRVIETLESRAYLTATFTDAVNYPAGTTPQDVAIADLNADGNLDLINANAAGTADVTLFPGNGDGTFGTKVDLDLSASLDNRLSFLQVGDLNGDALPDIVTGGLFTGYVGVLINQGSFTFAPLVKYTAGDGAYDVRLADFNGDGETDLAVVNSNVATVSVLLGNGDGTFSPKTDYTIGSGGYGLTVADFNADGTPDIATANVNDDSTSVLLNAGDGTFATATEYRTGDSPYGVNAADFNGDGKPDLAIANYSQDTNRPTLSVLMNKGDGTFGAARNTRANKPLDILGVDLDDDGKTDLVAPEAGSVLQVYNGRGASTFTIGDGLPTGTTPIQIATADLNGDGKPDLVTANSSGDNLSVLLNTSPDAGQSDLSAEITKNTLPSVFVPGDKGSITLKVTNVGTVASQGTLAALVYLSTDTTLDGGDIVLAATNVAFKPRTVNVKVGKSTTISGKVVIPDNIPLASYYLIAQVVEPDANAPIANNAPASANPFESRVSFGQVGDRKNVKLTFVDGNSTKSTFSLSGPGMGDVTFNGDGHPSIVLSGTTLSSKLTVGATGGTKVGFVDDITVNGPLGTVNAAKVQLVGNVTIAGDAKSIVLAGTFDDGAQHVLTVGGATPVELKLGNVTNTSITSTAPLKTLAANLWVDNDVTADVITSPWIGSAAIKGNFAGNLALSGAGAPAGLSLKSFAATGELTGTSWQITGDVGTIRTKSFVASSWVANISGALKSLTTKGQFSGTIAAANVGTLAIGLDANGSRVLVGTSFGPNGVEGGGDDTRAPGVLTKLTIGGAAIDAYFAAGLNPIDGPTPDPSDILLEGGELGSILIKGPADLASKFVAATLPEKVKIDGQTIIPAEDPRFVP